MARGIPWKSPRTVVKTQALDILADYNVFFNSFSMPFQIDFLLPTQMKLQTFHRNALVHFSTSRPCLPAVPPCQKSQTIQEIPYYCYATLPAPHLWDLCPSPLYCLRDEESMPQPRRFRETVCHKLAWETLYPANMGILRLRTGASAMGLLLPQLVASAMGSWLAPLRGTFAASVGCLCFRIFVASVSRLLYEILIASATWDLCHPRWLSPLWDFDCLRYVIPLSLQLVALAMGSWLPLLGGTFVTSIDCFCYVELGCLGYTRPASHLL